ncbi:MAG: (deoxy)nucleoside triphosphate pyrophosphohydrolase [Magnetococcales bacterium]|nr:(deoxy)nucleoside triphosphate pyrophosphohydrolase [Magnetococcales bacterium]
MKGPLILVSAGLVVHERRVLLGCRGAKGPLQGCWEFPGGKVEPGESPEEALVREMREEVALEVDDLVPWRFVSYGYPAYHVLINVFHCRRYSGEPKPVDPEVLDVRWVEAAELDGLKLPPANEPLLAGLMNLLQKG